MTIFISVDHLKKIIDYIFRQGKHLSEDANLILIKGSAEINIITNKYECVFLMVFLLYGIICFIF